MCILTWLLDKADIQRSLNQFSSRFALRSSFPCTHAPSNMIHSSLSLSLKPEFFDWQHANEPFIDTRPTRPIGLAYTASDVPPTTLLLAASQYYVRRCCPLLPTETEFLLIELRKQLDKIRNSSLNTTNSARNVGFFFDEHLTFSDQISGISKACYYRIRQLRCIRPYLDSTTTCELLRSAPKRLPNSVK